MNSSFPSTGGPSQPYTPNNNAVYIDDGLLGKGVFTKVRRVVKARDGELYAMKKCFPPTDPYEDMVTGKEKGKEAGRRGGKVNNNGKKKRED